MYLRTLGINAGLKKKTELRQNEKEKGRKEGKHLTMK